MMGAGLLRKRIVSPLQFLVLLKLKQGSKYGYELLKDIRQEFEGLWDIKTGTFYPSLRSLETRGFVETQTRDDVDFYLLTSKGNLMLDNFGNRLLSEYNLMEKYFDIVLKTLPDNFRDKIFEMTRVLSRNRVLIYDNLPIVLGNIAKDKKIEFLENLKLTISNNLAFVDGYIEEVKSSE